MFSTITTNYFLEAATQIAVIIFAAVCLLLSGLIWFTFFNLNKIKTAIIQAQAKNSALQQELLATEQKIKIKEFNLLELLFKPATLFKILDLIFIFRAGKLSHLSLLKTLFK